MVSDGCLCKEILSRCFNISLVVLFVLYREALAPRSLEVTRLPRMQEVVGSNPTVGKIRFFTIYSIL